MMRSMAAVLFLALLAGLASAASYAGASTSHRVYLTASGRVLVLTGSIKATVSKGSMRVNGVTVKPGDVIEIVANDVYSGQLRIYSNGYLCTLLYGNATLVVNGRVVASNTRLKLCHIYLDPSTISSTLTVTVKPRPRGYTRLIVDSSTLIKGIDSSSILLQGLMPSSSQSLQISIGVGSGGHFHAHRRGYVRGAASVVVVNGHTVPMITSVGLAAAALVAAAAAAAWWIRKR